MTKSRKLLAIGMVAALGLAACGDDDDDDAEAPADTEAAAEDTATEDTEAMTEDTATEDTEAMTEDTEAMTEDTATESTDGGAELDGSETNVGIVFDITGRGDRSFNDAAAAGLDLAVSDFGVNPSESTPTGEGDRAERLQGIVDDGADLAIAVGFLFQDSLAGVAEANPDTSFGIIDGVVEVDNVASLLFAEEQGSFLVGAAAALTSETGTIGFIGGVENDLIRKFEAGYVAGAEAVNPEIEILSNYITQPPDFGGFNDPARAREIATAQYDDGADVIYSAAGASGLGAFEAAVDAGEPGEVWAIGVDSDQYLLVEEEIQPYILTSMLKKVDVAVYETIESFLADEFAGGIEVFDLAVGGVDYSTTGDNLDPEVIEQLEELKQQIIDGEITVPTEP